MSNSFNKYLADVNAGLKFQVVLRQKDFLKVMKTKRPQYVIVNSELLKQHKSLTPIMVPEKNGSPHYVKVMVTKGKKDISSGSLAVTGSGDIKSITARTLKQLKKGGVKVDGTIVTVVSKDIDALLALAFGHVDGALVTKASLEVIKKINPAAAASFVVSYESPGIMRAPLCTVSGGGGAIDKNELKKLMKAMEQHKDGKRALAFWGIDRWASVSKDALGAAQ